MKVNGQHKTIAIFTCLVISFSSCKKQLPPCSGNCSEITFSGIVYDKTNNQSISNQTISINLSLNASCLFCPTYKLASGKSGNDGRFTFSKIFDTSLLDRNHISINVSVPQNYIQNAEPKGPGLSAPYLTSSVQFYNLNPIAMSNLNFGFYPRTLLRINLHREAIEVPQNPYLGLEFLFDDKASGWGLLQSATNRDTTLTIYTTASIFTKIRSAKPITATNVVFRTDSIKCTTNGNNSIDISY